MKPSYKCKAASKSLWKGCWPTKTSWRIRSISKPWTFSCCWTRTMMATYSTMRLTTSVRSSCPCLTNRIEARSTVMKSSRKSSAHSKCTILTSSISKFYSIWCRSIKRRWETSFMMASTTAASTSSSAGASSVAAVGLGARWSRVNSRSSTQIRNWKRKSTQTCSPLPSSSRLP